MERPDATPNPPSEQLNPLELGPGSPVRSADTQPWVRMDADLTRAVLAKTEEELLGGLAALMRNRVEIERAARQLTQILEDTSEAQRELERVRQQVRQAEDELAVRQEEHVRLREQTAEAPGLTPGQEMPGVGRDQPGPEWDELQDERECLSAELEQLRATYFAFQMESNRSRESLEEEIGTLRQDVARWQTLAAETARLEADPGRPSVTKEMPFTPAPDHDSYPLQQEFFTDEPLDAQRVVELVGKLPGVNGCLLAKNKGAVLASQSEENYRQLLNVSAEDYTTLFERLPNGRDDRHVNGTRIATYQLENGFLTVAQADHLILVTGTEPPGLKPGMAEKLATVARELSKMYPA